MAPTVVLVAPVPGVSVMPLTGNRPVLLLVMTSVTWLVLLSASGMLMMTTANDLVVVFVALEVLSLPLYLLAGMARRKRLLSQEAALKYFRAATFQGRGHAKHGGCQALGDEVITNAFSAPADLQVYRHGSATIAFDQVVDQ